MPAGGGNPKQIGDGTLVKIRPDYSRGGADLWDARDVLVAQIEERQELFAALAAAGDFATFKTNMAALEAKVVLIDQAGS
jgi:hypothetical protein